MNLGATHSLISCIFLYNWVYNPYLRCEFVGVSLWPIQMLRGYYFYIGSLVMQANLILIGFFRLDIIFGMDFLATNYALIDCFCKKVTFRIPDLHEVVFYRDRRVCQAGLILTIVAHHLLRKGYIGYLAYIIDTQVEEIRFEDITVVQDFHMCFRMIFMDCPQKERFCY